MLAAGVRAARRWWELLQGSEPLAPVLRPELDIVTLVPRSPRSLAAVDAACQAMLERGMAEPDPSKLGDSDLCGEETWLGVDTLPVPAAAATAGQRG